MNLSKSISQRPYLQKSSHWGIGLQHMNVKDTKVTSIFMLIILNKRCFTEIHAHTHSYTGTFVGLTSELCILYVNKDILSILFLIYLQPSEKWLVVNKYLWNEWLDDSNTFFLYEIWKHSWRYIKWIENSLLLNKYVRNI